MTRRNLRFITKALAASLESDHDKVRIGAVIVDGNYVVSRACNVRRTHTRQHRYNVQTGRKCPAPKLHAEIHALIKSRDYDLTGCTLYVGRYQLNGSLGNCKPCSSCRQAIKDSGIKKIVYTTEEGVREEAS